MLLLGDERRLASRALCPQGPRIAIQDSRLLHASRLLTIPVLLSLVNRSLMLLRSPLERKRPRGQNQVNNRLSRRCALRTGMAVPVPVAGGEPSRRPLSWSVSRDQRTVGEQRLSSRNA